MFSKLTKFLYLHTDNLLGLFMRHRKTCMVAAAYTSLILPFHVSVCKFCQFQTLDIMEGDLPESTTDFLVSGAGALMFTANSLSRLRDARRIYISGVKIVFMRAYAATNLDVLNLRLEVENCDVFRIEENTFTNIKGQLFKNLFMQVRLFEYCDQHVLCVINFAA